MHGSCFKRSRKYWNKSAPSRSNLGIDADTFCVGAGLSCNVFTVWADMQLPLHLKRRGCSHGRRKEFFQGAATRRFFQNFFRGVEFVFSTRNYKTTVFCWNFQNPPPLYISRISSRTVIFNFCSFQYASCFCSLFKTNYATKSREIILRERSQDDIILITKTFF